MGGCVGWWVGSQAPGIDYHSSRPFTVLFHGTRSYHHTRYHNSSIGAVTEQMYELKRYTVRFGARSLGNG